jgi:hypothetical protein
MTGLVCGEPFTLDSIAWGQNLSAQLSSALDAKVDRLRALREELKKFPCTATTRKAAAVITEWSFIADLLGDLADPFMLLRLFAQREAVEAYVGSITEEPRGE